MVGHSPKSWLVMTTPFFPSVRLGDSLLVLWALRSRSSVRVQQVPAIAHPRVRHGADLQRRAYAPEVQINQGLNLARWIHGCWETFYIFAYCGLVGNLHLTAKTYFLLPFQRQPSIHVCNAVEHHPGKPYGRFFGDGTRIWIIFPVWSFLAGRWPYLAVCNPYFFNKLLTKSRK